MSTLRHAQPSWVRGKRGEIDLDLLVTMTLARTGARVDRDEAKLAIGYAVNDLLAHCDVPRRRNGTQAVEYVARASVRELADDRQLYLRALDLLASDAFLAGADEMTVGDGGDRAWDENEARDDENEENP